MGFAHKAFVAAGVGFAAAAIAGCGSGGRWLSQSESNGLSDQLNSVAQALNDQTCQAAQNALTRFENTLAQLNGVDSTLLANLNQGASTVQDLTNARCASELQTPKTDTKASTTPTTTATQTATQSYTSPTDTNTTDTTATYPSPSTSTTGGSSSTSTSTSTTTTTPSSGGQGLGGGSTTGATGSYGNPNPNSNGVGNAYGDSGGGN